MSSSQRRVSHRLSFLTQIFLLLCACSGGKGSSPSDGGPPIQDSSFYPDSSELWPCDTPGEACNAHDTCAIDPICGEDRRCHPSAMQDCDDALDCTEDICKGMGLCEHIVEEGRCALKVLPSSTPDGGVEIDAGSSEKEIRCFDRGDQHPGNPCMVCDPDDDPATWAPANGGYCDDGDPCTKDDYCQSGVCKGVDYAAECSDEFSCTEDQCDGQGGCIGNQLKSDWCLINGVCYQDQATHPSGSCFICDPAVDQSDWTPVTDTCLIGAVCYNNGGKHPEGCAECDPAVNTEAWTVKGNDCLIEDTCYAAGTKDSLGCSQCDPASDRYGWTPLSGVCFIAGQCHSDGDPHPQGCAECDPDSSNTSWTVTDTTYCIVNENCVDKATSIVACGACGVACGPGESCAGGVCSCGDLSGTVGSGAVCGATESCDQGQCVTLPPGTLVVPLSLDFESSDGGLNGTQDWEWGNIGPWAPTLDCDSGADPPTAGHSGLGVWATKLNDCYSPLGNATDTCNNSDPADDSILSFKVKIPANLTTVTMTFWQWYDLFLTFDWTEIRVDGDVVVQTCTGSAPSPPGWTERSVDLSAYAGKIVEVAFHMMATTVVQYSGWYIDDLSISGS